VRLVQVDEGEPLLAADGIDPLERRAHRLGAGPLGHRESPGRLRASQPVVVDVEAPVETEPGIERERADEGPGLPALLSQDRGEGGPVGGETEARVVADAVVQRVLAREQVGVGGKGDDVVGVGRLEAHALRGQAVDPGRAGVRAAVAAERVGAQRVDGDEQDGQPGVALHACRAEGSPGECADTDDDHDRQDPGDDADPAPAPLTRPPVRRGRSLRPRRLASTQQILRLCFDSDTAHFLSVAILVRERGHPWIWSRVV
jgi:hypothetical protein